MNKDAWSELSLKEKANIIRQAVSAGIKDLSSIANEYNLFSESFDKSKPLINKFENGGDEDRPRVIEKSVMPEVEVTAEAPEIKDFGLLHRRIKQLKSNLFYALTNSDIDQTTYDRNIAGLNQVEQSSFNNDIRRGRDAVAPYLMPLVMAPAAAAMGLGMYPAFSTASEVASTAGNYLMNTAAGKFIAPALPYIGRGVSTLFGLNSAYNLASDDGVRKTYGLFQQGWNTDDPNRKALYYQDAMQSLAGDALDVAFAGMGFKDAAGLVKLVRNNFALFPRSLKAIKSSQWYKDLVNEYGEVKADLVANYINTPEFRLYFYGNNAALVVKEAELYAKARDVMSTVGGSVDEGRGAVAGSAVISKKGTLNRSTAVPHDIDMNAYLADASKAPVNPEVATEVRQSFLDPNMTPLERLARFRELFPEVWDYERVKNAPILLTIRESYPEFANAPVVFKTPMLNLASKVRLGINKYLLPEEWQKFNPIPDFNYREGVFTVNGPNISKLGNGASRFVSAKINGQDVDLFLGDSFIPQEAGSSFLDANKVLDFKRDFVLNSKLRGRTPRPKDVMDLENYSPFSASNPVIDLQTGSTQYAPFSFGNRIISEEGYPVLDMVETYPGSGVRVPAFMNTEGKFLPLIDDTEALFNDRSPLSVFLERNLVSPDEFGGLFMTQEEGINHILFKAPSVEKSLLMLALVHNNPKLESLVKKLKGIDSEKSYIFGPDDADLVIEEMAKHTDIGNLLYQEFLKSYADNSYYIPAEQKIFLSEPPEIANFSLPFGFSPSKQIAAGHEGSHWIIHTKNDSNSAIRDEIKAYIMRNSPLKSDIPSVLDYESDSFRDAVKDLYGIDLSLVNPDDIEYFSHNNLEEILARGSQIKDFANITSSNSKQLTKELLLKIALDYVKKTGVNNNMSSFLYSIVDWDKAAKFLNKYAPAIAPTGIGAAALLDLPN